MDEMARRHGDDYDGLARADPRRHARRPRPPASRARRRVPSPRRQPPSRDGAAHDGREHRERAQALPGAPGRRRRRLLGHLDRKSLRRHEGTICHPPPGGGSGCPHRRGRAGKCPRRPRATDRNRTHPPSGATRMDAVGHHAAHQTRQSPRRAQQATRHLPTTPLSQAVRQRGRAALRQRPGTHPTRGKHGLPHARRRDDHGTVARTHQGGSGLRTERVVLRVHRQGRLLPIVRPTRPAHRGSKVRRPSLRHQPHHGGARCPHRPIRLRVGTHPWHGVQRGQRTRGYHRAHAQHAPTRHRDARRRLARRGVPIRGAERPRPHTHATGVVRRRRSPRR